MARYRKISVRIWNDAKFASMSDDAKLAFFFALTHPHMTALGAMRGTTEGMAAELGWSSGRLAKAFREASSKGVIQIDEEARCVFLPNFIKHNPPESPNVVTAWEKSADDIPECDIKTVAIQTAISHARGMSETFAKACERLSEAYQKGMPNQEQEQEQEQEVNLLSGKPDAVTPKTHEKTERREAAKRVLAFLNEKANRVFPETDSNLDLIAFRIAEGFTEGKCRQVIVRKCDAWAGDEKMATYLRPKTLFGKENFSNYVGEIVVPREPA